MVASGAMSKKPPNLSSSHSATAKLPVATGTDPSPINSPFAGLGALRETLPTGEPPKGPAPAVAVRLKGPARAVVRLERKGRGGKEATLIEKLELSEPELANWCKQLKQALGCGGSVDGDTIVLSGDLRPRLPAVLTAKGVRKVTVS